MWTALINFFNRITAARFAGSESEITSGMECKAPAVAGFVQRVEHLRLVGDTTVSPVAKQIEHHFAARLASVARLNTPVGRKPFSKPAAVSYGQAPKVLKTNLNRRNAAPPKLIATLNTAKAVASNIIDFKMFQAA